MRILRAKLGLLLAFVVLASLSPSSAVPVVETGQGPALASIGPLAFGPDGTLFAADNQGAAIFALDLGAQANGGAAGAKGARRPGRESSPPCSAPARAKSTVTDLAVHPRTRNAYVSVMRGQGAGAAPALFRIDGAGKIANVVAADRQVPEGRAAERAGGERRRPARTRAPRSSPTWRSPTAGCGSRACRTRNSRPSCARSRIRSPRVDRGVSVEIYHGNHKAVETRSPVNAFVPYTLNNQQHLIAGYTCTPLVKFPIADLKPGEKVRGTTIAEFGAGNRVLDMIVYSKGGQEFLLTANNSRGVMKIPTSDVRHRQADHRRRWRPRPAACRSRRSPA